MEIENKALKSDGYDDPTICFLCGSKNEVKQTDFVDVGFGRVGIMLEAECTCTECGNIVDWCHGRYQI